MGEMGKRAHEKIATREQILPAREKARADKKVVGFTSGVFDILHRGHVEYLEEARARCDVLIVAVNSDESVRALKGPSRPICRDADRALVVAGLESVDHVFVFGEANNKLNIETLKPDRYIKAGDYDESKLSSAPLVQAYGGEVVIVPATGRYSTTAVVEKIASASGAVSLAVKPYERAPAVFVDRDGTIIEHVEYLHEPEKLVPFPGALAALGRFKDAGYRIVVITNQPGIGLGYFAKEDFFAVNRELLRAASEAKVEIDRVYFCPHSKADGCSCRKPGTGLVDRAVADLNIDLSKSVVIGDMTSDVMLAKKAGCRSVLVMTGRGGDDRLFDVTADFVARDLTEAASLVLDAKP